MVQRNGASARWKYDLVITGGADGTVKYQNGYFAFHQGDQPMLYNSGQWLLYSNRLNANVKWTQPFDVNHTDWLEPWWNSDLGFNIWDQTHQTHLLWGVSPTCTGESMTYIDGNTVYTLAFRGLTFQ